MNIEIKNKNEHMLLSRIEIIANITFDKNTTPSKEEVRKALSKALDVDKALIVTKKIHTEFGNTTANVLAYQYINKEELTKLEPMFAKEQEDIAKKAAEAKAKEAPVEEKKEEPKAEEKPAEEKKE